MDEHDPNFMPDIPESPLTARDLFFATVLVAVISICALLGLEMHDA